MVVDAGLLTVELLLVAFAGGAIGAAIGGYPAYGLAGLVITVGELSPVTVTPDSGTIVVGDAAAESAGLTGLVGYGPVLGPHVAFAGGVAAAAYAGRKGHLANGFEYHAAKRVTAPIGSRPDVLVVGGVFGIIGYWLAQLSVQFSLPWDPVAASVVLSALLHRTVFGYPLVGRLSTDLLDMTPYFEHTRTAADATNTAPAQHEDAVQGSGPDQSVGDGRTDGAGPPGSGSGSPGSASGPARGSGDSGATPVQDQGPGTRATHRLGTDRPPVEPWLPHQSGWANVTVLGAVVGVFAGFVALSTGSYFLPFGLTAATLLLLIAEVDRFPVTHHMALPAGIAALALPEAEPLVALLAGAAFGAASGLAAELFQRVFYAHADTHFDPPSAAILVTTLAIAALDVAGVVQQSAIPTAGIA